MAEEKKFDKTNTGSLNVNERKREGKQDPDYTGRINIEGKNYWLSGWKKTYGEKTFLSLSAKPTEPKIEQAKEQLDIPF
jgi:hypothetical protein